MTTRKLLIAGNWKMNLNHLEAIALVQKVAFTMPEKYLNKVEVAVIPPFTDLRSVQTLVDGDKLQIGYGAQDVSAHESGAYTGEVSAAMLAKLGCRYVLVGHSERRAYHGETDEIVAAKIAAAYAHDLTPILCVGEGLEVREAGQHLEHTTAQVRAALAAVPAEQARSIVLAYEPIWAIGTGRTPTVADIGAMHRAIRALLVARYGEEQGAGAPILYGGPVKPDNARELLSADEVGGALVGGASLSAETFLGIVIAAVDLQDA